MTPKVAGGGRAGWPAGRLCPRRRGPCLEEEEDEEEDVNQTAWSASLASWIKNDRIMVAKKLIPDRRGKEQEKEPGSLAWVVLSKYGAEGCFARVVPMGCLTAIEVDSKTWPGLGLVGG